MRGLRVARILRECAYTLRIDARTSYRNRAFVTQSLCVANPDIRLVHDQKSMEKVTKKVQYAIRI